MTLVITLVVGGELDATDGVTTFELGAVVGAGVTEKLVDVAGDNTGEPVGDVGGCANGCPGGSELLVDLLGTDELEVEIFGACNDTVRLVGDMGKGAEGLAGVVGGCADVCAGISELLVEVSRTDEGA